MCRGRLCAPHRAQVESLELGRDSAGANHKRELAAAQRDAAQAAAQHVNAVASLHADLDWHKSEVGEPFGLEYGAPVAMPPDQLFPCYASMRVSPCMHVSGSANPEACSWVKHWHEVAWACCMDACPAPSMCIRG